MLSQKANPDSYREKSKKDTSELETDDSSTTKPGLICLKGGDLAAEIQESGTRPRAIEIKEIFAEDFFKDKYILYVPR